MDCSIPLTRARIPHSKVPPMVSCLQLQTCYSVSKSVIIESEMICMTPDDDIVGHILGLYNFTLYFLYHYVIGTIPTLLVLYIPYTYRTNPHKYSTPQKFPASKHYYMNLTKRVYQICKLRWFPLAVYLCSMWYIYVCTLTTILCYYMHAARLHAC